VNAGLTSQMRVFTFLSAPYAMSRVAGPATLPPGAYKFAPNVTS
jgi:hypothetical protein